MKRLFPLLVLLTSPLLAQSTFEEQLEVREVLLDVVVTDKAGNAVLGLGVDDFTVREDGRPVALTASTFYSSRELLEVPDALHDRLDTEPRDRYFILLFDDQKKNQTSIDLVSRQLRAARDTVRWVHQELAPADWVAVVGYDFRLKVYEDFTRDRQALARALRNAATGREPSGNWPSRLGGERSGEAGAVPSLRQGLPTGRDLSRETPRIYDAFEHLAQAAGAVPGRKNLIYFGLGFGDVDDRGIYRPDQRYYPPMVETLNDHNVAVYSVDISPSDVRHSLSGALSQLAEDTGGRYFERFTNFASPLKQISRENGGYYLLSYRSGHPPGESGFQKVEVELADRSLRVRARGGYRYGND
ncbi:MAG: VWA domain-containing protein [Acidobacteriota bacterium]